jgi:hypothetical protein
MRFVSYYRGLYGSTSGNVLYGNDCSDVSGSLLVINVPRLHASDLPILFGASPSSRSRVSSTPSDKFEHYVDGTSESAVKRAFRTAPSANVELYLTEGDPRVQGLVEKWRGCGADVDTVELEPVGSWRGSTGGREERVKELGLRGALAPVSKLFLLPFFWG